MTLLLFILRDNVRQRSTSLVYAANILFMVLSMPSLGFLDLTLVQIFTQVAMGDSLTISLRETNQSSSQTVDRGKDEL